ncbi:MAG: hypothetical protein AAB874_00240 [Patescibacteria group bacterium]
MGYGKEVLTRVFQFALALPFSAVYFYPNTNESGGRDTLGARITRPGHDKPLEPDDNGIYTIEAGQIVRFFKNGKPVFNVVNDTGENGQPQSAKVEFYGKKYRGVNARLNPKQTVWNENGTLYFDPSK